MRKLKVLLAIQPKMLSEVIRNMIARQPDMEVVGELLEPTEFLVAVRTTPVDVIIVTPLDAEEEPRICRYLLTEHPQVKIITLSAKGDAAFLYELGVRKERIDQPSKPLILGAIRESKN
ncbi:MAG: hypothetical protein ACRENG_20450 [bacterium]